MFEFPVLKSGCRFYPTHEGVAVEFRGETFTIELDEVSAADEVLDVLRSLSAEGPGRPVSASTLAGKYDPGFVSDLLGLLDSNYLLTDSRLSSPGLTGIAFAAELEGLYYIDWMQGDGETELASAVYDGRAPRDVVIGWGFECYHVTTRAHDCLSPAIARFHGKLKNKAVEYFLDEYRHDKLIMKALLGAGFRREDVINSAPLPYTQAVMNLLARWAQSDLLSFMACLFVFEGTREIGDAYISSLAQYDLPADFVEGQAVHNDINNDGDHSAITRAFFAEIEHVSSADQERVRRNLRLLYDAQRRKHRNVLDYYSAPTIGIPRRIPDRQPFAATLPQVA